MVPWVDGSELTPRVCFLSLNLEMVLYPKKRSLWSAIGQGLSIPGEVWTSAHSFRNQQPPGDECGLFSWGHLTWRFFFLIMQSTVSILYGRVLIIIVYIYVLWEGLLRILWLRHVPWFASTTARSVCQMFRLSRAKPCAVWIFKLAVFPHF